jgi:uncharacterized membrane protein (Fun14 family)
MCTDFATVVAGKSVVLVVGVMVLQLLWECSISVAQLLLLQVQL